MISTRASHVVPHRSTDRARGSLTSEIRRDPVLSAWYGRSQTLTHPYFLINPSSLFSHTHSLLSPLSSFLHSSSITVSFFSASLFFSFHISYVMLCCAVSSSVVLTNCLATHYWLYIYYHNQLHTSVSNGIIITRTSHAVIVLSSFRMKSPLYSFDNERDWKTILSHLIFISIAILSLLLY